MGNLSATTEQLQPLTIKSFTREKLIGKGGFGKVWKAKQKNTDQYYAVKEMNKSYIIKTRSFQQVHNERNFLSQLHHPFIVNMRLAFQDKKNLYLILDYMPGGDLRYHLTHLSKLSESQTKFIVCCLVLGLEFLHKNSILHKDIKPENLVFDKKGYLRLTDFGIAQKISDFNPSDRSGTPSYMSPEVLFGKYQGMESDYYSVGVIAYECMTGKRPYSAINRHEIKDEIKVRQVHLKKSDVPIYWSLESVDFINKLINRNPSERLGINGSQDLKNHSWLLGVEWKKMLEKKIPSPCLFVKNYEYSDINISQLEQEENYLYEIGHFQNQFSGFEYDSNSFSSPSASTINRFQTIKK